MAGAGALGPSLITFDREIRVSRSLATVRVGASLGVWSLSFLTGSFRDTPLTSRDARADRLDHEPALNVDKTNIPAPPPRGWRRYGAAIEKYLGG